MIIFRNKTGLMVVSTLDYVNRNTCWCNSGKSWNVACSFGGVMVGVNKTMSYSFRSSKQNRMPIILPQA
jgi:hypothetical protein